MICDRLCESSSPNSCQWIQYHFYLVTYQLPPPAFLHYPQPQQMHLLPIILLLSLTINAQQNIFTHSFLGMGGFFRECILRILLERRKWGAGEDVIQQYEISNKKEIFENTYIPIYICPYSESPQLIPQERTYLHTFLTQHQLSIYKKKQLYKH